MSLLISENVFNCHYNNVTLQQIITAILLNVKIELLIFF